MSETGPPVPPGDFARDPSSPEERCLDAIDRYLRHDELGVYFGDVPAHVRSEWREIAALEPQLEADSAYHWGWMCAELELATLRYADEPDATEENRQAAHDASEAAFNKIIDDPTSNRFDRARASVARGTSSLYMDVTRQAPALPEAVDDFCETLADALKNTVAWYQKTKDPHVRKYANALAAMGVFDARYAQTGAGLIVTPSPSRFSESLGGHYQEPSDLPLWILGEQSEIYMPARLGQSAPRGAAYVDPLLLGNDRYSHTGGHTLGGAQAIIDQIKSRGSAARQKDRTRHLLEVQIALSSSIVGSARGTNTAITAPSPETVQDNSRAWYMAHVPGRRITDLMTLFRHVDTLSHEGTSGRFSLDDIEMLGWMYAELGFAIGQVDPIDTIQRCRTARELFGQAPDLNRRAGRLAQSHEATLSDISMPLYGAIATNDPNIRDLLPQYRTRLAGVAEAMLEDYEQTTDSAQRQELNALLHEVTASLLLLSDAAGSYIPVLAPMRVRSRAMAAPAPRSWRTSVFIADTDGNFTYRAARLRYGARANDASLDEGVLTLAPSMVRGKQGEYPLLHSILAEVRTTGRMPKLEGDLFHKVFKPLEVQLNVADLV